MPDKESTMKWKVDVSQLKAGMSEAKRSISLANSEFKNATAGLGKWQDSITGVEAKIKQLNTTSQSQERILSDLKQQYNLVASELGETSPEAEKLKIQINNQEAACKRTKAELEQYNSRLSELKAGEVDSRNAAEKLSDTIGDQESKLKALKSEYAAAALEYGKNSTEAKQLAGQIKNLSGELSDNKSKLANAEKEADKFDKTIEETGKDAEKAGKGGFTVFKGALANLVSAGIMAAVKGLKDLVSEMGAAVKDATAYADEMNTAAKTTGLSTQKLQEYAYMADFVDVSVDTLTGSLSKLIKNMASAKDGNGAAAEAFKKLGVSVTDVNGELRDNEDVFADVISALGEIDNETERDALAMQIFGKSAQELNPLIETSADQMEELRQEAHEMGAVLDQETLDALNETQDSMERFGKVTTSVKRQFAGAAAPIIKGFLDPITQAISKLPEAFKSGDYSQIITLVMSAFMGLLSQVNAALPKILEVGMQLCTQLILGIISMAPDLVSTVFLLVSAFLDGLSEALPQILEAIPPLLVQIVQVLTDEGLPMLLQSGISLIFALLDGILSALPELISALPVIVESICGFLIDNLPMVLDAGLQLLMGIIDAIPILIQSLIAVLPSIVNTVINTLISAIPILLKSAIQFLMAIIDALPTIIRLLVVQVPDIVNTIISTLLDNLPLLIQAAIELFFGILEAIPQICMELIRQMPQIIASICEGLLSGLGSIKDAGLNLIKGLWEGIKGATQWIKDKIKGWVGNVVDFLKRLFGINSPSKLMADAIGKWLPRGLAAGFEDDMPDAKKKMQKSIDAAVSGLKTKVALSVDGISPDVPQPVSGGAAGGIGGRSIIFNQYNNSPKALDRLTVYRQTNSLLFGAEVRLQNV